MIQLSPVETIPTRDSSGSEWILWHKALRSRYGRPAANQLLIDAWQKRGCVSFIGLGCDANTTELRNYLAEQKIQINRGGFEYLADSVDDLEGFAKGFFNVGSTIMIAMLVVAFGLVALLVYNVVSNKKLIGDAASAAISTATRRPV